MKDFQKYFRELSLKLELFTSIIPIPSYVYFVALVGAFQTKEMLIDVAISGVFAGSYTVLWGLIYRYTKLKKIFQEISRLETQENKEFEEVKNIKIEIMKYPFKEVKVIIYRWIIGCTSGLFFYIFLQKGKFPWEAVFAIYIGLLFVLPISSIIYLFESEMIVKKILDREIFYGVEVQRSQIPYFGYFRRILFSILAIAITPITIMGFIIYSIVS